MELLYAPLNQPVRILTANKEYCYDACTQQCRLPAGHPEGFYEAFGNIYRAYCLRLLEQKGETVPGGYRYPTLEDGIAGLRFTEACIRSAAHGNIWVELYK